MTDLNVDEFVNEDTEDVNPDEENKYGELDVRTCLVYRSRDSVLEPSGFMLETKIYKEGKGNVYTTKEKIDDETAREILEAKGGWDYME